MSTVGPGEWFYGVVAGTEVTNTTSIMAELHATSGTNFTRDVVTLNLGLRHALNDHAIRLTSFGHDVHSRDDEPLALIGYLRRAVALLDGLFAAINALWKPAFAGKSGSRRRSPPVARAKQCNGSEPIPPFAIGL